jgi:hypothetical protein
VPLDELIPVLQTAIGPVILISGVGALLLSMNHRLGRTIDRSRILVDHRRTASEERRLRIELQLGILWRRARILQKAITLAVTTALLAASMVIVLFVGTLFALPISVVVVILFSACLASFVFSLGYYLKDVNLSLRALAHELEQEPVA